ncbi:cGMP-inhibited 3',5'-cyclic phosphodiesterase A-like [Pollicipes pollicipes]|uniref:cGMP-inhibited 3',5'-cyclic phosphodiesterase A-like n=1 Tax=Pollicipes pollicipes TaxID=41117 RepID=UPI001884DAA4|nr:cGMP-inhibited 3',5'-cyclic phosphodiesterase A-like [Pollicipes pollicipes]
MGPLQSLEFHKKAVTASTSAAIIAESHGIVTDLLVDSSASALPPHILAGLHTLAQLLEPPSQPGRVQQHPPALLRLDDALSSSTDEIPFTGETAGNLQARKRAVHPAMLRRMSCSMWSTTTSATGMPTIEPEPPNRRRATSFRNTVGGQARPHRWCVTSVWAVLTVESVVLPAVTASTSAAIIAESHGIVTDLLVDSSASALPPHILAGLHTLAQLLEPPSQPGRVQQHPPALLRLDDALSSSTDEIPFTGETAGNLQARKRAVHPAMLRRMSCSMWSTTTSATGMPTIEPEPPNRRRATSFRNTVEVSPATSPSQSSTNLTSVGQEPAVPGPGYSKPRSLSVSALQPFSLRHRLRERRLPLSPGGAPEEEPRRLSDEDAIPELDERDAALSTRIVVSRSPSPNVGRTPASTPPPTPPPPPPPPPPP